MSEETIHKPMLTETRSHKNHQTLVKPPGCLLPQKVRVYLADEYEEETFIFLQETKWGFKTKKTKKGSHAT